MKILVLVRHAKSSWDSETVRDHDRPLNQRGMLDAPRMGAALASRGIVPELLMSSTAVRAEHTARAICTALGRNESELTLDERLYHASARDLLCIIRGLDDTAASALIVCHNPTVSQVASSLTGSPVEMPTAAVAVVELPCEQWAHVSLDAPAIGKLALYTMPKNLGR